MESVTKDYTNTRENGSLSSFTVMPLVLSTVNESQGLHRTIGGSCSSGPAVASKRAQQRYVLTQCKFCKSPVNSEAVLEEATVAAYFKTSASPA